MTQAMEALVTRVDQFLPKYITALNPAPKNAQGFEMELETKVPIIFGVSKDWISKKEGSLRNYGTEIILRKPLAGADLIKALENVSKAIELEQGHLIDTIRTSTHVHHNIQDKTGIDLLSIFGLYWIVEDLLMDYCGKWRKGNYNCLTLGETNSLLNIWSNHLREFSDDPKLKKNLFLPKNIYNGCTESFRYSALNPCAIKTFGSIEFRGMRSITKADDLILWSKIIQKLIDFQEEHGTIDSILKRFKNYKPDDIVLDIFGMYAYHLLATSCKDWQDELTENLMKVMNFRNSLFSWDKQGLTEYYKELLLSFKEYQQNDPFSQAYAGNPKVNFVKPPPIPDDQLRIMENQPLFQIHWQDMIIKKAVKKLRNDPEEPLW